MRDEEYLCDCLRCAWCRDGAIEAAERIINKSLSLAEALTSYRSYERQGVEIYKKWEAEGLL